MATKYRSIVFYASPFPPMRATVVGVRSANRRIGWINIRTVASRLDYNKALDNARPRKGETVLNAVPFPA